MEYSSLINNLKEYFTSRGFQILVKGEIQLPEEFFEYIDLLFRDARNIVAIKLIPDLISKDQLTEVLTKAAVLREYIDKVYVAISAKYKALVNGRLFTSSGIGLILVSEDGEINEVIPPRPSPRRTKEIIHTEIVNEIKALRDEILRLKRQYSDLARKVEELKELAKEVEELRGRVSELSASLERREVISLGGVSVREKEEATVSIPNKEELPSYLRDNTWLQVLSRRGKER
ncbi:MAG: hypothetical protein DRJ66_02330 [Thermoprotei archaeon]|nr:MAG: hypothetical protein DRJ66_02330 [Thermoprotei archaeon]